MTGSSARPSELLQNWRLVVAATLCSAMGMPTLALFSIGIFAPIFAAEFGWSFAAIMGGLLLSSFLILGVGPFIGRLADRYGTRGIGAVSLAGLGVGYISFAAATGSIVQYYASWFCFALFGMGATAITFSHAISRNFSRQRGLALGIALSGSGLCAILVKLFGNWAIDMVGWRLAIVAIGACPILIGIPLILWGFPRRDAAVAGDENTRAAKAEAADVGLSRAAAFKSRAFWLIAIAFAPIAFANGAPLPNMENILKAVGVAPGDVAQITAAMGISILAGRVIGGWLIDHFWAPAVAAILLLFAMGGCLLLAHDQLTHLHAIIAVATLSAAAGMEYDLLAFLIARYIGVRSFGAVYGILFGVFAIGAGGGPALLGHAFDLSGSYSTGLLFCAGALGGAIIPILLLGRYPSFASPAAKPANQ